MAYLAPIHRPSSVRHAIKLNLISEHEEVLVLAKANRIEVWQQSSDTGLLTMLQSKAIHGRVTMLDTIRPYWSRTDHLFVGTQRFQYFTLDWDPEYQTLRTVKSFVDVSEKHMRDSQSRDRCLVDPTGKHLMLELYEGVLSFVRLNRPRRGASGNPSEYMDTPEQIRISELRVRSTCFLHTETNRPKLAILYESGYPGDVRLATYRIVDEKGQYSNFDHTKDRENEVDELDLGASHLIPVPKGEDVEKRYIVRNASVAKAQVGGVIVVGETKMTYLDDESKALVEHALDEASIWVAWEQYNGLEYFLADDYGGLHVLSLTTDESGFVTGMQVKKMGITAKATSMVHLGHGVLFIASHEGDVELVRVTAQGVENLQTMPNIAPILDFAVMDLGGREGESQSNEYASGQARLVTGSGAYEKGSLRSVRSGVGLEDIGILLDLQDIQNVFSLKSSGDSDDILVVSLPFETRIFLFKQNGDIEEVGEYRSLITNEQTLQVLMHRNGDLLQVTPHSVVCDIVQSKDIRRWQPPNDFVITVASANEDHVLLAVNGTKLVSLGSHYLNEVAFNDLGEGDEVACVHLSNLSSSLDSSALSMSVGVVGFWKSGSISILDLQDLSIVQSESLQRQNNASIPRDIALTRVLSRRGDLNLFVAMEDGVVLSFQVDENSFALTGRKSVVLGTQQAHLTILPRPDNDAIFNVFATCEHPSLIYGSEGRIVYSAVTAEKANFVAPFNNEAFPDSIILATSTDVKISKIDSERRTHVRMLPMGRTIRRIAYSAKERVFGIGAIRRELVDNEETVESSFELVEDVLFNPIGQPFILQDSNGQELVECVTRASLQTSHSEEPVERFLVGTSYLSESEAAGNAKGRLLVFGIDPATRSPFLVCSHIIKGACRQIGILDGKIVASLMKTVVLYKYEETSTSSATLKKLAAYRTSTCPIDLAITDNIIAVADMIKSVSIIEYEAGNAGEPDKLTEVARHHQACWATAVASLGNDEWLETDDNGNLIVLKRNKEALMDTDKKKLEVIAEGNLGEMVNCIKRIDVDPPANALIVPKAFLGTTEGSIYLLSSIPPSSFSFLSTLQSLLANFFSPSQSTKVGAMPIPSFTTLGDLDFNTYRAFKNQERETAEPYRLIDGELIERFLDLTETQQVTLLKGTGLGVEDVRGRVEMLRRGH